MLTINRRSALLGGAATALTSFGVGAALANNKYREIGAPKSGGVVAGRITYAGNGVTVPSFPVIKDQDICGTGERKPKELRVGENGEFADCVIEIKGVTEGKAWEPVFNNGKIYQIDCSFQPYVQIVRSNAFVDVHNFGARSTASI